MSERAFYLDHGVGEDRAVVTLGGQPELLLISREGDEVRLRLGARSVARVRRVEPALGSAFVDLGRGGEALLPFKPDSRPVEGSAVEVEIRSEPRRGKLPVVRLLGPSEGEPRLLAPGANVAERLAALAKGAPVRTGPEARRAAEEAEAEVMTTVHALPGGGDLAIEPTRALTAVDIDLGARKGPDAKRVTRQANLAAIREVARLLRLKAIGGLVVIDLVGRGHDGPALMAAARAAFAPENPGVAIGPITKFGTMELSVPRRTTPIREVLCRADGALTDETLALRLVRTLQSEAWSQPGARLAASAHPDVVKRAGPLLAQLAEQVGGRIAAVPAADVRREFIEVRCT